MIDIWAEYKEGEISLMPFYVYRIDTVKRGNYLLKPFENISNAKKYEDELKSVCHLRDDYFITIFFAKNDKEAEIHADKLRRDYKKL